jgi:hypothetical protein
MKIEMQPPRYTIFRGASPQKRTAAAAYPPYDDYQRRAKDRQIPVVVLEPV